MSAKGYSRESIAHALAHHESRGALLHVSPPEPGGRSTWRVVLAKFPGDPKELTEPQAYALCLGLAAAEDHARVEHERFVHELHAYNASEPPCVDDDEVRLLQWLVKIADSGRTSLRHLRVVADSPALTEALERALSAPVLPAGTRCGIHGHDTSSGRCDACDLDMLIELTEQLDNANTLTEAEPPFERLVWLVDSTHSAEVKRRALAWSIDDRVGS